MKIKHNVVLNKNTDLKKIIDKKDENTGTIGGFLVGVLGRIPAQNEKPIIKYKNIEFKILSVNCQRINKIKAMRN